MTLLQPRPVLGPPAPWRFPAITSDRLANGMAVHAVHLPGKQLVALSVLLGGGVDTDPAGLEGLAVLTAGALDLGTASFDETSFAAALESQGASLAFSAGWGGASATLQVPGSRLHAVLPLLVEALATPTFPADPVARVVRQRVAQITQQRSAPGSRAAIELTSLMNLPGSRGHLPMGGTAATVAGLTPGLMASHHAAHARAAASSVVVAGDLSGLDVVALLEQAFAPWTGDGTPSPVSAPAWAPAPAVLVVDRPGSVQTQLLLAHPAPARHDPAWPAMQLAAYALGGTLTSRIDAVLREEKGYTYGVRASYAADVRASRLMVTGSVDSVHTGPALADLQSILRTAAADGLRQAELDAARAYLVGVSPMRWETPEAVVGQVSTLVTCGLPLTWTDDYLASLRHADLAAVDAVLANHVRPAELFVVAVGEADAVVGPLTDLGLGTPVVVPA